MQVKIVVGAGEVKDLVLSHILSNGVRVCFSDLEAVVEDGCFRGFSVSVLDLDSFRADIRTFEGYDPSKWQKLAMGNNFILAIKELRTQTNIGLKEAKDIVDKYRKENGI